MSLRALLYAYVLGGLTFIPLLLLGVCFYTVYTSVPVGDPNVDKLAKAKLESKSQAEEHEKERLDDMASTASSDINDFPRPRKGWLTVRRTFEETASDGSYVGLVRGFLDARSKDPKRSRPKDMWYVVLKGKVLYLYEDENMTDCEAAIELGGHDVVIYPEGLQDGELFAKRNAICLKPKATSSASELPSITKEMMTVPDYTDKVQEKGGSQKQKQKEEKRAQELEKKQEEARQEALDPSTPWFIFVKSNVEMEEWYFSLVHASDHPPNSPTLTPLQPVFLPSDMLHLVETLDEQPDVIPMRWLNALIGRLFFSFYRTQQLESYIIGRLMKKLSKIKRPNFLTDVSVREVSVGNRAPTFSKPMLKELTKEGDASLEVHLHYKGEIRITVDATATINLGARFKSYTVKLVLAAVLREIEGNLLVKVKRPPSNRIWYAFTQMPRMVLDVEPVVSERQITWSMILSTIEARLKEVIQESVVLPNMDDIAFFDSLKYSHRGGIWGDASRHEGSSELYPSADGKVNDDSGSTISAPVIETSPSLLSQTEPAGMERSHSAPVESTEDETTKELLTPGGLPRPQTIAGASSTSSSIKRRTWFGGPREGEEPSSSPPDPDSAPGTPPRGRSGNPLEAMARRSSNASSTVPEDPDYGITHTVPAEESEPSTSRRSVSQHSRTSSSPSQDGTASTASDQASTSAPSETLFAGFRSKSPGQSSGAKGAVTSPTSNFFQTLKTRDKQAISNNAKEVMRKWGVNWGMKKDSASSSEEPVDGDSQRLSTEPTLHKPRPSYADVRAAVAQRKGVNPDELLSPTYAPSEPVTIPESPRKERTASILSSKSANGQSNGGSPSPSVSPQPDKPVTGAPGSQPRSISPALTAPAVPPRPRAISHQSQSGLEGVLGPSTEENEQPTQLIHTQPSAPKAMTIPGIHASHRGEVMSMGYVAPTPPPAEPKKPVAIQSVYRLWKNPNQAATSSESPPETESGFDGRDQDAPESSTVPAMTMPPAPSVQGPALPARPVPPPLPPRSNTTHALHVTSESPRHSPELDRTSPASAALQSIVSRDKSKRSSLEPPPKSEPQNLASVATGSEPPTVDTPISPDAPLAKPKPPALPPRRPLATT